jgi:hypothetical protein
MPLKPGFVTPHVHILWYGMARTVGTFRSALGYSGLGYGEEVALAVAL